MNAESNRERSRMHYRVWRKKALQIIGIACAKCGYSDSRALQIDHVNGGGSKERKTKKLDGYKYCRFVYNEVLNGKRSKYQILCANCNAIKRVENNECANQTRFDKLN